MTRKRFRKLLQAHFTAYYQQDPERLAGWISRAYRIARESTSTNYAKSLDAVKRTIPLIK